MMKKRVLITGGTSGMGLSAAGLFLKRGWQVLMAGRDQVKGEALKSRLGQRDRGAFFFRCDVTRDKEVKALYEYAVDTMGGVDSVVNNAGIWTGGMLHETEEEAWDRVFNTDVKSIYMTSRYFVPHMIENGGGTIVNTASVSGLNGDYGMAAYNAAKGAVVNLARAMALDYGQYNIRVNNVCPGACATPMFLANAREVIDSFNKANPIGRICDPLDVAKAMYFLASDESAACNGMNLTVSGGMECHTGQPRQ